jgi:23S rRNA (pseudouridine1915-N3)-methyltransferase
MRLLIVAASNRQPSWVAVAFHEYAKRFRGPWRLELKEVALARRRASEPPSRAVEDEGERMLAAVPAGARVVALSDRGDAWTTTQLAARFEDWKTLGAPVCLLIGGPDGLARCCVERADESWALSPLTLPHGLVRIIAAEALYRAWSIGERHPYHRA